MRFLRCVIKIAFFYAILQILKLLLAHEILKFALNLSDDKPNAVRSTEACTSNVVGVRGSLRGKGSSLLR